MKELTTMNADTLLATALPETEFLVENMIPQGLHIFAGPAKTGKSWFMLDMCLKIATGEPLLNFGTVRSDVLYLCLEDTYTRVQQRLKMLTDNPPDNLRFCVTCSKLGEGLIEQIEGYIKKYPQTKLIVIDTLQKIRGNGSGNSYAKDYNDLTMVKQVADKYKMAIMLVHHLRKAADSNDPFNQISGTTGLSGCADAMYILQKLDRSLPFAFFDATGRDFESVELLLKFENHHWKSVGGLEHYKEQEEIPIIVFKVINFMEHLKEWCGTMSELLLAVNDDETLPNMASKHLNAHYEKILKPLNIGLSTKRTSTSRQICLVNNDDNDDCDD